MAQVTGWFFGLLLFLFSSTVLAESVIVAVASNFKQPLSLLAKSFEVETGYQIKIVSASSGKLYAQIINGAPFDVFLSADEDKPTRLIANNLAIKSTEFVYAEGILVLAFKANPAIPSNIDTWGAKIFQGDRKKLAIANPKLAPYGRAANEALTSLPQANIKIIMGDNIAQTFQFVESGNVDFGLVAKAQVMGGHNRLKNRLKYINVPKRLYNPIKQVAVLLTRGKEKVAAKRFLAHLKNKHSLKLITHLGYLKEK